MTYREMAMDAGYRGDEADQMAAMLEQQEHDEYDRWAAEQQQLEQLAAERAPRPCASQHHDVAVAATVVGQFRNRANPDQDADDVAYCAQCATVAEEVGYFTPTGAIDLP